MSTPRAIILHASTPTADTRHYRCQNPLELSEAVAHEIQRAGDPTPIMRWMEEDRFYQFWSRVFDPSTNPLEAHPTPGACLYSDAVLGGTVDTVLWVEETS